MTEEWDLPEGWEWAEFQDVADVVSDLVDPAEHQDSPHIAPNHIESGTGRLLEYATIASDKVTSPKHRFHPGQILYSKIRPYLCKAVVVEFAGLCSADMYPVAAKIDAAYLHKWLISSTFTNWASNQQGRTVLPKINQEALAVIKVPVPPLAEQRRIVAQIEALQARSRKAREALEAIPALLEQYRQSVLASAFRGDLTADWREQHPDVEPASALLDRIRQERRRLWEEKNPRKKYVEPEPVDDSDLPELPEGWCWASLEEVASIIADIDHKMPKAVEAGVLFLSAKDLLDDGTLNFTDNVKRIGEQDYLRLSRKVKPQRGDVIYSRIGARLGKARVVETDERFLVSYSCCTIRPLIDSTYLALNLDRDETLRRALGGAQSIGVPDLGLDRIKRFPVPLCSVEEERVVTCTIAKANAAIRRIKLVADSLLSESDQLDQSILAKAFRGELVEQDPSDEPASALLERIRAERAASNGTIRKARRTRT